MEWRKPSDKKFTDLCIYIDANIEKIKNAGEYPDVEDKIYNYLWLLVKALAIKKCMFQKFEDYDPYAFYSASRLFFALRKNLQNQGKKIKGKEIKPIKSCLNYTKALMYPMKVEYQRETYREIIDEEFVSKKFDAFSFNENIRNNVKSQQAGADLFPQYVRETFEHIDEIIDTVLKKSPFVIGSLDYKKLKISLLLNCLLNLKTKKRLEVDNNTIIVWKLPKSMISYIKILLKELYTELKTEILDCYKSTVIDDETADRILKYKEGVDYEYEDND